MAKKKKATEPEISIDDAQAYTAKIVEETAAKIEAGVDSTELGKTLWSLVARVIDLNRRINSRLDNLSPRGRK